MPNTIKSPVENKFKASVVEYEDKTWEEIKEIARLFNEEQEALFLAAQEESEE